MKCGKAHCSCASDHVVPTPLQPVPPRPIPGETATQAITVLDAQFPWLRGAEKEFRKIIEVGLASLAAEKAGKEHLAAMRAALDTYRAELAGKHVDCNTDLSFHTALAAASGNTIAVLVWEMLSQRL